jgi:hypothetical protein
VRAGRCFEVVDVIILLISRLFSHPTAELGLIVTLFIKCVDPHLLID